MWMIPHDTLQCVGGCVGDIVLGVCQRGFVGQSIPITEKHLEDFSSRSGHLNLVSPMLGEYVFSEYERICVPIPGGWFPYIAEVGECFVLEAP